MEEQAHKKLDIQINYWMVKLSLDHALHHLQLLQYVRTHKYYLFMILFNKKTVFFVRKDINEVSHLDIG